MSKPKFIEKTMWILGIIFICVSVALFAVWAAELKSQPKNVALTTAAWNAFNAGNYPLAISKARECIDEFRGAADRQQAKLEKQKVSSPSEGRVGQTERQKILARGPLNDAATCYYVIGRSAEYLNKLDLAKEAYENATRYTYARTWDPAGQLFWSPAEAASDRLAGLK
ncbi:MAG: hypothetical protein NTX17_07895 [Candidatus Eisenbacteria bacterium]|nr:hypothetical protein [Candidatus Eisenbacteria bacterium]